MPSRRVEGSFLIPILQRSPLCVFVRLPATKSREYLFLAIPLIREFPMRRRSALPKTRTTRIMRTSRFKRNGAQRWPFKTNIWCSARRRCFERRRYPTWETCRKMEPSIFQKTRLPLHRPSNLEQETSGALPLQPSLLASVQRSLSFLRLVWDQDVC